MALLIDLLEWSRGLSKYGAFGLFTLAFMESSFFPIPPDILLIPLVLAEPSLGVFFAVVALIGSVFGAVFGYYLGHKGGRPLLQKLFKDSSVKRVEKYYDRYGAIAVGIAGFTPIPYKIFTISSGALNLNLRNFLIASLLSRGARFFLEALLLLWFGQPIIHALDSFFF